MRTLKEYLKDNEDKGIIDFSFRAVKMHDGYHLTLHPDGQSGETIDLLVDGNKLSTMGDDR